MQKCSNNSRDYFESDVDCGGNFCASISHEYRCLGGKTCYSDSDCLSDSCLNNSCEEADGYVNNIFVAEPSNIEMHEGQFGINDAPSFTVTNSIGLTTMLCGDIFCNNKFAEIEHTSETETIVPEGLLIDGMYTFYFIATNGVDEGPPVGPHNYTKFTPEVIHPATFRVVPSSAWNYVEKPYVMTDSVDNKDFCTGSSLDELNSSGTKINLEDKHTIDVVFEDPIVLTNIIIQNRAECCFDRQSDMNIIIYDEDGNEHQFIDQGVETTADYFNLNQEYFSDRSATSQEEINFDLTSDDPTIFGVNKPKIVTRVKIERNRHQGTHNFASPFSEGYVTLGMSELTIKGYAPASLMSFNNLAAPTSVELEEEEISTNPRPEFTVSNSIGTRTILCEDSDCESVIGYVDHDQEEKTLTPYFDLPHGEYTFYLQTIEGSIVSNIIYGAINYIYYNPHTIPSADITISGNSTTAWSVSEELSHLLDDNLANSWING